MPSDKRQQLIVVSLRWLMLVLDTVLSSGLFHDPTFHTAASVDHVATLGTTERSMESFEFAVLIRNQSWYSASFRHSAPQLNKLGPHQWRKFPGLSYEKNLRPPFCRSESAEPKQNLMLVSEGWKNGICTRQPLQHNRVVTAWLIRVKSKCLMNSMNGQGRTYDCWVSIRSSITSVRQAVRSIGMYCSNNKRSTNVSVQSGESPHIHQTQSASLGEWGWPWEIEFDIVWWQAASGEPSLTINKLKGVF